MKRIADAYAFAARQHIGQSRKGHPNEPYVNHVIDVAARVARSPVCDNNLLIAAVLHDMLEKSPTTPEQLSSLFGMSVGSVVGEVTDDPALPETERRLRQITRTQHISQPAKRITLADKASNLTALVTSSEGNDAVLAEYLDWAMRVVEGCRDIDPVLEAEFDAAAAMARRALKRPY